MAHRIFAITVALVLMTAAAPEHDAGACSCSGPMVRLLGPDRRDDVPLNAKVRVDVPAGSKLPLSVRVHARARRSP